MKKIKFNNSIFNKSLYDLKDIYCITSEKFWDGGYDIDADLSEKAEFYNLTNKFSHIIKDIVTVLDDELIIGAEISENGQMFQGWKDIKQYDAFNNLSNYINKKHYYNLTLPDDSCIIDYIIENNFRYLTSIDFYLPKSKIILQPTCHTEVFVYSENYEKINPTINRIIKNYPELTYKKYVTD